MTRYFFLSATGLAVVLRAGFEAVAAAFIRCHSPVFGSTELVVQWSAGGKPILALPSMFVRQAPLRTAGRAGPVQTGSAHPDVAISDRTMIALQHHGSVWLFIEPPCRASRTRYFHVLQNHPA